ncbi:MAG: HlyC/CorC family transporter [Rhodospirillales bacterium]
MEAYYIFAILILLILSAFFSGSETALTAASRPLLHQQAQSGNARAQLVNDLHVRRGRMISTILLGNNLVNILASALATSLFFSYFGEVGVAYATVTMTVLVLIFSEILPKTYAIRDATRLALAVAPLVNMLMIVFAPITRTVNLFTHLIFKIFGINTQADDALGSADEILRGAIELRSAETKVESVIHERAMLHSVLDLNEVEVGEIMVHRKNAVMLDAGLPIREIVADILESPYTRIPLWQGDQDNIIGVVHAKGLFKALWMADNDLAEINITALAAKPWFVPDSTSLLDQLQAFLERREHFALVVDEYGTFMGVVTLEDILEEIVGDITDEHDVAASGIRRQADGSYLVPGSVTIRDLDRELDWNLPDEEASTIAGLVLHESRRIPDVGQVFMFFGFRFEILRRQRHQITLLRITPPEKNR